jgi:hypothetical protein
MTLFLAKWSDHWIDNNPWWDLNQIRKVIDDDGSVSAQLKAVVAIIKKCNIFNEVALIDNCISFLPIKVYIEIKAERKVEYTIYTPFPARYIALVILNDKWPIKQISSNGTPCDTSDIKIRNIQNSTTKVSISMMSSGWTIITWKTDPACVSMLSDTRGRCRAFYFAIQHLCWNLEMMSDFQIRGISGNIITPFQRCQIPLTDLSDPPPLGKWTREHHLSTFSEPSFYDM